MASLATLVWVYQWAAGNNSAADSEHQRLITGALMACGLCSVTVVFARVTNVGGGNELPGTVMAGALGAFVAIAASAASTLLIAMAISPATDPGDFGRPTFRLAYVGALVLSLCAGSAAAWAAGAGARYRPTVSVLVVLILTLAAWGFLSIGSSELNQCVVDDEFPLKTDHVCSGY